ncbi:MAG: hypothetical protein AMJ81_03725 [Phycisphaerae bacterium SM23_33]|nr:MAG: hypothetical protein AMJ81_03725 [Phycisphaerae bacterium SM23_33]
MELAAKPDYEECMDRVEAWWDCGIIDRPPVTIHVRPERPAHQIPAAHESLRDRWLDAERAVARAEADAEAGVFLAETFPRYMPNLGPEICATCYGAELEFSENTSWSVPCAGRIRDVLDMHPDLDTPYWNVIRRMTELSAQRGAGRWITGVTDLHTNGDLLAALRDPQALALDYADDFAGVQAACRHVTPHAKLFFDDLYGRIAAARPGESPAATGRPCCTWGLAVSRKTMYYVSCDFICMISPAMFADTILPAIEWEIAQLDRSIFHLDGPGTLQHLDALLAIPRLNAVQWVYGAGAGRAADWINVYRRVQAAGKGIEVIAADMDDARAVMENVRPEGAWLSVGGSYSRDQAAAVLHEVRRWAEGKR